MAACTALANCPGPGLHLNITAFEGLEVVLILDHILLGLHPHCHLGWIRGPQRGPFGECVQGTCLWGQV